MKSGRKPTGTIERTATGFRVRVKIDGKPTKRTFEREDLAEAFLAELLDVASPARRKLFSGFGEDWLDARETKGIVKHVKKERSVWNAHVRRWECYEWPIAKIARKHVAAFVSELESKPKGDGGNRGRSGVKHALRLIKRCFDAAANQGLVSVNPAIGIEVERKAGGPRKWTYLSLDEIERVFAVEHCERKDMTHLNAMRRAAYAIAIYGGLRKSEIWNLRWEDVTIDGRPNIYVREGKSDSAVRDVPLLPQAVEHVRRWRDFGGVTKRFGLVFKPDGQSARSRHGDDFDAGWRSHPRMEKGVRKVRRGTMDKCDFGRHVRFHDLRHTCASHLVMGSWTPAPLAIGRARQWLGHSSQSVTERYAHMSADGLHAAIEAEESRSRPKGVQETPSA